VGVCLAVWGLRRMLFRVLVCPRGIIQVYWGRAEGALWEQIITVDTLEKHEWANPRSGYTGRIVRTCIVYRRDGFKFVFERGYPKHVSRLAEMIVSHTQKEPLKWRSDTRHF
jgi:hypothetical protein